MYYDVLINYCGLDPAIPLWFCKSHISTYNEIRHSFSRQIKSNEYSVYVRKVFKSNDCEIKTNFKYINRLSYTFRYFPSLSDSKNKYYVQQFNSLILENGNK